MQIHARFVLLSLFVSVFGGLMFGQASPGNDLKSLAGFQYKEKVENAEPDAKNLPLVIGLHWSGSTPDEFYRDISGFDKPVRILLLQGPYEHPRGGFSFYVRQPLNYYDMSADDKMKNLLREAERLSKFIEAATVLYTPKKKPMVIGASQGGDLSYVAAIRYGSLISAAFPLLATFDERIVSDDASRRKQAPIYVYHGMEDPIVPVASVEQHVKTLRSAGFNALLSTYPGVKHDIPAVMKNDYMKQIGKVLF